MKRNSFLLVAQFEISATSSRPIEKYSLTSLQQRLVKTGGRLVKHARYYSLLLAEGHLNRRVLPTPMLWFVRIGVPLSAILISAGFFFSVLPPTATQAGGAVSLIYAGALILAVAVITLGIGLLRAPQPS